MYIRISRGHFDPARLEEIRQMLQDSQESLAPALQKMPGFQNYHTGIDPNTNTMIAVSLWDSAEHAAALGQLPEMNALRPVFQQHGVSFDPISTYEIFWTA
jgi:quinol monooxygenase YgiN